MFSQCTPSIIIKSVDEESRQLFRIRSRSLDKIPPTSATLKQHILRASHQGSHVWGQVHLALPELPSPTEWGWKKNSQWKPLWPTLPQAQHDATTSFIVPARKPADGCASAQK